MKDVQKYLCSKYGHLWLILSKYEFDELSKIKEFTSQPEKCTHCGKVRGYD